MDFWTGWLCRSKQGVDGGVSMCGERGPRDGINDGPREDVMVGGEGRKEGRKIGES